jgi:hypothetical protein
LPNGFAAAKKENFDPCFDFLSGEPMYCVFIMLCRCALLLLVMAPLASHAAPTAAEEKRIPGPMVLPQAWPGGETMPGNLLAVMNHVSLASYRPFKGSSPYTMTIKTPAGTVKAGPRRAEQFVNVFKLRYSVTDRFEIRTATPYIDLGMENHNGGDSWKGGLGDTTVMLRYGIKRRSENSPFSLAVDLGGTVPTGEAGDSNRHLASNAFSVIAGGGASWVDHNQRVDIDGRYAVYTEGAHDIRPGNFALFHFHYAYALTRNFDLGMEAYYRIEEQSYVNGVGQGDGFSEAYLGPKIQIKVPQLAYLMLGAAVLFPVYRDYHDIHLSTDTRYEFSILMAF